MSAATAESQYEGHRVRVMWERPFGIWDRWAVRLFRTRVPIYVFVAYAHGRERPLRICLREDQEMPFVIENPLDYDGGYFDHGPYTNAVHYDDHAERRSLSDLFDMLLRSARNGTADWADGERLALKHALNDFYSWIWRIDGGGR